MTHRILVIDDDVLVRETIAEILSEHGYEVILAQNGHHGLAIFRSEQLDLVITDIVMPVMEGIQTIIEMRRERPDTKIIAVSAGSRGSRHDFLEIAQQLGARDVIVKPFDADDLVARIDRCLDGPLSS